MDRQSLPVGLFPGAGVALTPQELEAQSRGDLADYLKRRRRQALEERDASSNRIRNGIFDWMQEHGASPEWANRAAGASDFLPAVGDASQFEDAYQAGAQGNYGTAALLGGLGVLGVLPAADLAARPAAKAVGAAADVGRSVDNVVPLRPATELLNDADDALAMYRKAPGSEARYLGAAPDRSAGDIPRYKPAKTSARMMRLNDVAHDPESALRKQIAIDVEAGKKVGGLDWYNTEELRDWFINEHGEEVGGEKWRDFISMVGATSTGSKVPANLRTASFYASMPVEARKDVAERVARVGKYKGQAKITPLAAAEELGHIERGKYPAKYFTSYGHKQQRNHAMNVLSTLRGDYSPVMPEGLTKGQQSAWLKANPKIKGFGNDLLGNRKNIAADMHFMRMLAMADGNADFLDNGAEIGESFTKTLREKSGSDLSGYIKKRKVDNKTVNVFDAQRAVNDGAVDIEDLRGNAGVWASSPGDNEYDEYERLAEDIASDMGLTPAQFQAALWMGAGERTKLADTSKGTFMQLFRKAAEGASGRYTKAGTPMSPAQATQNFLRGGLLGIGGLGLGVPAYQLFGDDERQQQQRGGAI